MDPFRGADKKLGDLMLRGWTMLADSCITCRCPLMRSPDGQKYCVNCEVWVYDNKKREPKKFSELFSSTNNQMKQEKQIIQNKKEIQQKKEKNENEVKKEKEKEKEKEIQNKEKEEKKVINNNKNPINESFIDLLNNKLKNLAQSLNDENDIKKSEEIIGLMDKIMNLIEHYKKII